MAISLSSLKKNTSISPPRILMYGVNGIGKTTFGSAAPNPVFILTERGLGKIKADFFEVDSFQQVVECIESLLNEEHKFQTLVIDSIDWLEALLFTHVAKEADKQNIADIGYGKGYSIAEDRWFDLTRLLDQLIEVKKMSIILIGHALVKKYDNPDTESYDRYRLDMHEKSARVLIDWSDIVLFSNYKVYVQTTEGSFNKKEHKGIGNGERVMYSEERPAFIAKNRYGLPPELPLSWQSFSQAMGECCK